MFYEPDRRDRALLPHDPFKAMVAPRPIGWISTRSLAGAVNLAPYSFFNAVGGAPPLLAFSSEGAKDSAAFAEESGEFVWNMASFALRDAMNASAASLPRGQSEFDYAGLETAPCVKVKAPRVAASSMQSRMQGDRGHPAEKPLRRADGQYPDHRPGGRSPYRPRPSP